MRIFFLDDLHSQTPEFKYCDKCAKRMIYCECTVYPSRKCIECGKMHDTVVQNNYTGERLKELDKCRDCIMSKCAFNPIKTQITLQDLPASIDEYHLTSPTSLSQMHDIDN
jgi:hypothetical protein